ncbi:hypothetical protein TNCT_243401 [Trichonephila clavata]|uniref:Uncharacterized protein n=1 Tax=Trichonephila clavata TaxID=2740835 RepID=A0A8X6GVQ9_TRICU|nr:hypothetical protein TNCT_243401 [Trichonephila clavata]
MDVPKVNVCLGMHTNGITSPFFFVEKTITGHVYPDTLGKFTTSQIPPGFLFRQEGTHPRYQGDVTAYLNRIFQRR